MASQLQDTLGMFAFLAVELSALFIGISLLVGVVQRHIPPSRVETLLGAHRRRGYFLAAGLGAITPFCSCSTIPMLKGLIRARAGFGPMMVFLFASPLLNPIIVALLIATFGITLSSIYVLAAFMVSLGAGRLLQTLGFERYVRQENTSQEVQYGPPANGCCNAPAVARQESVCCDSRPLEEVSVSGASTAVATGGCCEAQISAPGTGKGRYTGVWRETWSDFRQVLPYLLVGIVIGSAIYGFMPSGLLEKHAGPDNPLAIPVAAIIGIPLYIRAEAVIPMAAALMAKGVGAGTVLALIIGSAGASLTELILLRSLFTLRLLAAFVAIVLAMAMVAGYTTFLFF
ncbi:permease [Sedimenticola thiotaurini]|uniref:Permease n=1 Tax=Sedimenticola thiotaurini TaxID=1543721 RepID=A0A0F7JUV4_9GAMM|nr:permease [Sedimenticola thiotaurini]AKH20366.1 permease [Sedimenticola thiotaurini]